MKKKVLHGCRGDGTQLHVSLRQAIESPKVQEQSFKDWLEKE